jgi:hypothetical protein
MTITQSAPAHPAPTMISQPQAVTDHILTAAQAVAGARR